uniref:Truncated Lex2B n=1 Tax=Haemophilus influenzae TaxID=727 RepID=C1J7L3_HAEIF|nr:truncated Lex2B [Haemophilus influenzae]
MFITPIFIINLEKSTDRKAYMQAQFEQLFSNNLIQEIHFFDAIYGKSNPNHPLFQRYNENKRLNAKGYPLTLGQRLLCEPLFYVGEMCRIRLPYYCIRR